MAIELKVGAFLTWTSAAGTTISAQIVPMESWVCDEAGQGFQLAKLWNTKANVLVRGTRMVQNDTKVSVQVCDVYTTTRRLAGMDVDSVVGILGAVVTGGARAWASARV